MVPLRKYPGMQLVQWLYVLQAKQVNGHREQVALSKKNPLEQLVHVRDVAEHEAQCGTQNWHVPFEAK